ncbi:hypothetical protein DH2020_033200 [Rehmannia glutinosa]|uniref:Uncharacterized protein n=1 Tax=Rehmannia glutinosa TaxID=99300 RepID=A0ABR0VGV7_REHGL
MAGGESVFNGDESAEKKSHTNLEIEGKREKQSGLITGDAGGEEENDCPIEQVRLTVPPTDDPSLPALTFRTWFLGLSSCVMLAFVNQFFGYRQNSLYISAVTAQIVSLPVGKFMAKVLPTTTFTVPFTSWSFSFNPGPFNLKEHVLITIFASCGSSGVYAVGIVTIVKAFTTDSCIHLPPGCWLKLHRSETQGRANKAAIFLVVFISSFAYYIVPAYFAPSLSSISVICLIFKDSIFPQQLGSGLHGMGIGSFALDWATTSFIGNPISTPGFAIINSLIGFFLVMYVMTPLTYFNNVYNAKTYPIFSSHTFDSHGHPYNISRVLNAETFSLDMAGYQGYSKLYLSVFFAFTYGLGFASLAATITHVALYHGKTICSLWSKAKSNLSGNMDVHARLMKRNYETVPNWWFYSILGVVFCLSLWACEGFGKQLQLPWWGLIMACVMALFFTLPIGIIQATTNQQIGLNIITEMVIGYVYPGRPLANVAFKTYGYISMVQALGFLSDFKLGHYMKIPPKSMFIVQLVGTVVASSVYFSTSWWLLTTVEHICDTSLLPDGSPWTCPGDDVFYNASIIWGVIGPLRMVQKKWWARHAYVMAAALNAGIAFLGVLLYFTLQSRDIVGPNWWGLDADDHCPLATCPTAPGVVVKGCPVQ